jgi:hypothetical protein
MPDPPTAADTTHISLLITDGRFGTTMEGTVLMVVVPSVWIVCVMWSGLVEFSVIFWFGATVLALLAAEVWVWLLAPPAADELELALPPWALPPVPLDTETEPELLSEPDRAPALEVPPVPP